MREPADPMDGGLTVSAWLSLWKQSHAVTVNGLWRHSWPSNDSTLAQPALTVALFDLISNLAFEVIADGQQ